MTDEEFEAQMMFEREIEKLKYCTIQSVHLFEAFQIFEDEVFDICMDHLSNPNEPEWMRALYEDLLEQFKRYKSKDDQLKVQEAKQHPIHALFDGQEATYNRNIKCPLHDDKTASLKLYQHNNTYYCFGCNAGGDTIDFLMRKNGVTFIQAVKWLTNS